MSGQFKKNGIVCTGSFSDTAPILDMETKILSDGSAWVRVFMHNCHGGTVLFTSYSEVMNTQTSDKYSRLYLLDKFKAQDNKFEFMLCYPDDTTQYNRWKQTNNPCNEYKGTSDGNLVADGYEAIHIDWSGSYWGGLTRQNSDATNISPCYLSGSVGHGNWFYAIGSKSKHGNGIPSYSSTANRCELWVRIDTLPQQTRLQIYNNFINLRNMIEI